MKNGITLEKADGTEEVLQVEDNLKMGVWNSSDTYASIKEGKKYKFKTAGYRRKFTSSYKNIVGVEEVK